MQEAMRRHWWHPLVPMVGLVTLCALDGSAALHAASRLLTTGLAIWGCYQFIWRREPAGPPADPGRAQAPQVPADRLQPAANADAQADAQRITATARAEAQRITAAARAAAAQEAARVDAQRCNEAGSVEAMRCVAVRSRGGAGRGEARRRVRRQTEDYVILFYFTFLRACSRSWAFSLMRSLMRRAASFCASLSSACARSCQDRV